MTTALYWFNELKRYRSCVFDEEKTGRPADAVTEPIIQIVEDMILAERRMKVREVVQVVGVSNATEINIPHDKLALDNKRKHLLTLKRCLERFKRDSKEFLYRIVTFDET